MRSRSPDELDFSPFDGQKVRQTILESHHEYRARMIRFMLWEMAKRLWKKLYKYFQ